jgi:hypothetical protein
MDTTTTTTTTSAKTKTPRKRKSHSSHYGGSSSNTDNTLRLRVVIGSLPNSEKWLAKVLLGELKAYLIRLEEAGCEVSWDDE